MGIFERYLSVWVGLCILLGVVLGNAVPDVFAALAAFEFARVNLVVAALFPASAIPASLGEPATARWGLAIGTLLAAGLWIGLVVGMHGHLKRTFMATVRQLAGLS